MKNFLPHSDLYVNWDKKTKDKPEITKSPDYFQNKFEENTPKIAEIRRLIADIVPFKQSELDNWELTRDQINFWQDQIKLTIENILTIWELQDD